MKVRKGGTAIQMRRGRNREQKGDEESGIRVKDIINRERDKEHK